ncbi:MAG TPA: bifunctional serine/threonine-protein kinase/formylglycine-generating enzyme family protein [Blastocatellia bacterium]|nr:bifunctional serine/threonine-protein kinase/formylglycine-generating enzyme family protein [Blastocatellia bacterium]
MAYSRKDPYKLVGTTLDRYVIEELVGIGGMGAVYRAQHEITKAKVAIKILRPDLTSNNEADVGSFFEEATKTVALNHPSIIKVTNADYTADGAAYMVMEWLDGCTLDAEMKELGALSLERTLVLLEQISDAVAYAHKKGVIHRDLKPSNIMLVKEENGEETIRVLDFGIAKVLMTTVGTNTRIAGTSYYISPEQTVAHSQIDQTSDIYSLGIILFQMLTGQVPFEAETEAQVMDLHRSQVPISPRRIREEIPPAVEEVVLKALAKKSPDRFPSATDLARAFRQAMKMASGSLILRCEDESSGQAISFAEVYLNGKQIGQTDKDGQLRHDDLLPRHYIIEIEASRYLRCEKSIDLMADQELMVEARLEREPVGELILACNVSEADVLIDGRKAGRTDQTGRCNLKSIPSGTRVIRVTHPRYVPAEETTQVDVWRTALVRLKLQKGPSRNPIKQLVRAAQATADKVSPSRSEKRKRSNRSKAAPPNFGNASSAVQAPPSEQYRPCLTCHTKLSDGSRYCTQCGSPCRTTAAGAGRKTVGIGSTLTNLPTALVGSEPPAPRPAYGFAAYTRAKSIFATRPFRRPSMKMLWLVAGLIGGVALLLIAGTRTFSHQSPSRLRITTSPSKSQVTIDRQLELVSDQQGVVFVESLEEGSHTVKISKPGYQEVVLSVKLPLSTPLETIVLEPNVPEGMILIPGGTFQMGDDQPMAQNISWPPHETQVGSFYLDRYEVTRERYLTDSQLGVESRNLPMTGVTWTDADNYCRSIGKRLPSEAEWEFAARRPDGRRYPWGSDFDPGKANIDTTDGKLSPVGSHPGGDSASGISDLTGNAWEWTADDFRSYPGSSFRAGNCPAPCKIIRGGAFDTKPELATATYRAAYPITSNDRSIYANTGFRCAKDASK